MIDRNKLEEIFKDFKFINLCEDNRHFYECINISGGNICWKCKRCNKIKYENEKSITI